MSSSPLSYCRSFVWYTALPWTSFGDGVLYSARCSYIDGGFLQTTGNEEGKWTILSSDRPNPQIGFPYTYLITWCALHCPAIIQAGEEPPEGVRVAHLRRFEGSSWSRTYVAAVHKLLCRHDVYSLFRCFPYIRGAGYGEEFKDVGDGETSLSRGIFEWLVSIRPSHLMYRSEDTSYLEPYVPSLFVRQFGYDQLYVDNPNTNLAFMGSLIDGVRVWLYFIAACTEARLCMPLRTPNLLMTLGFCQWYRTSSSAPTGFSINSFGLKLIS